MTCRLISRLPQHGTPGTRPTASRRELLYSALAVLVERMTLNMDSARVCDMATPMSHPWLTASYIPFAI